MNLLHKIGAGSAMFAASAFAAMPAWAQEVAEEAAPVADKGDTAWMMVSTVLVLMMILPGLALFYGGLTRTKNMLSTMTQRSEEHTSELQSLMRTSYAVFCLK